jgi:hypothetical protein
MHATGFPWGFLIPLVAIGGGLAVGVVAIVTEHRRKQAMLAERRLMIEKGMTPPPLDGELLDSKSPAGTRNAVESSLRNGIRTLFVGLGLIAAFLVLRYVVGPDSTPIPGSVAALLGPAGALVALIGVGHLVYFRIARDRASARDM